MGITNNGKGTPAQAMAALPAMPRSGKRNRAIVPCACGCGLGTKSTWHPGHDGRATGWAVRVERGIMKIEEVPANERKGAEIMLARRAKAVEQVEKVG